MPKIMVRQAVTKSNVQKIVFCLIFALSLIVTTQAVVFAQKNQSKADLTPTFWQRDPDADFEDEGRMHCAPSRLIKKSHIEYET